MKTQLSTLRRARGFTYITVVVTMVIVGFMLAAYLKMVSVQNQLTMRSQTWNRSVPVLEAGVEEAMAHLNKNGTPDSGGSLPPTMTTDGWTGNPATGWTKFAYVDNDFYFVQISPWLAGTHYPFINSTGYVMQLPAYAMSRPLSPFLASVLDDLVQGGKFSRRIVQCTTTNNPTFSKGLVAKKGIDMSGNNVTVDSFDSANSLYSTGGRWDPSKRRANGDVASNDSITNTVSVGNANIYGRVSTGPRGTVSVGASGAVGDLAWHAAGNQGIKPGWSTDDMNVEIPDTIMPSSSTAWLPPPAPVGGVRTFATSGSYRLSSGILGGQIVVAAPNVKFRVDGGVTFTGSEGITINSNASLTLYLNCPTAKIAGQAIINRGVASQCYIFGSPNLKTLEIDGNGEVTAVVYAPQADVLLGGGGSSNYDFSGAIVANSFKFGGHYNVHYDEALGRNGLWRGYTITSWNER